jgi:hypothetical protein
MTSGPVEFFLIEVTLSPLLAVWQPRYNVLVMNPSEIVVAHIRSHPTFVIVDSMDRWNHMGATLADAVLQRGIDYKAVVEPRVKNLKAAYPEAFTTSAFARVLERDGAPKVLDWTDGPKPQTLVVLVKVLLKNGIETEEDLRVWLDLPASIICLQQIKGIKDKTTDYLKILVGTQTVAVDMHLYGFLEEAGVPTPDYAEAHRILRDVADILGVEASKLDHSIWRYGSSLPTKRRARMCQAPRAIPA